MNKALEKIAQAAAAIETNQERRAEYESGLASAQAAQAAAIEARKAAEAEARTGGYRGDIFDDEEETDALSEEEMDEEISEEMTEDAADEMIEEEITSEEAEPEIPLLNSTFLPLTFVKEK